MDLCFCPLNGISLSTEPSTSRISWSFGAARVEIKACERLLCVRVCCCLWPEFEVGVGSLGILSVGGGEKTETLGLRLVWPRSGS